ncbi:3843_t:CDS:1 [Paraglomus occultum]|uniref:3843_t:CDS:1 n=1 Tax=Paraglomus occultum TaxID=144539 RepID=A0A9N8W710_9GLOM|nr:3843_t:CDS:1 [Paraglomus occultum]
MYINSLPIVISRDLKIPTPVSGEGFFYRHSSVSFTVETRVPRIRHSARGTIYITDKRMIFVASDASSDGFETFYLLLTDIVSSVKTASGAGRFNRNMFCLTLQLSDTRTVIITVEFDKRDLKAKQTLEDYYTMITESVSAAKKKKLEAERLTLAVVSETWNISNLPEPPVYSSAAIFHDEELPPYPGQ